MSFPCSSRSGALAGTVTAANGAAIDAVSVIVTGSNPTFVLKAQTDSAGAYTVPIVPAGDYQVCFHSTTAPGTLIPYGYVDRCAPARVAVAAGSIAHADITLIAAGGISGRVTTADGAQIHFGGVVLFDAAGVHSAFHELNDDGSYTVGDLAPGRYTVCFGGGDPVLNPPYGYVDECYNNVVWNGDDGTGPPPGTTAVDVTAGATTSGINATLASAGGISGTLTTAAGAKLVRVGVYELDNSTGHPIDIRGTSTDYSGNYSILGLIPSTQYTVCFDGGDAGDPPNHGYASQCWRGVPWGGSLTAVPSGLSPVVVTSGAIHSSIDAALTKL